jgi:flavin reductase (DIM6/NTAB) family NADH-FMN oxidoreductase RutF
MLHLLGTCKRFNAGQVSHNPPMISLSFSLSNRRPKDTRDNILNSKGFTVSIISEPFVEAANSTSVESSADHDEWIFSGLTKESSVSFDTDLIIIILLNA